jgi:WD40 repeat protein
MYITSSENSILVNYYEEHENHNQAMEALQIEKFPTNDAEKFISHNELDKFILYLNGKNINDLDNSDVSPPIDSPIYDLSTDKTIQLKDVPERNKITNMTILNHLITVVQLDPLQYQTYSYIIQNTIAMNPNFTEFTGFKYTDLQLPLQSLNISYPFEVIHNK